MSRTLTPRTLLTVGAIALTAYAVTAPARAAGFAGTYANDKLRLELRADDDAFTGRLIRGDDVWPVKAERAGDTLKGRFKSDDTWFDFTATLDGDTLTLKTGGKTHVLKRAKVEAPAEGGGHHNDDRPAAGGGRHTDGDRHGDAPPARRFTEHRLIDEQVLRDEHGKPCEVLRMLVPEGWKFVGGLQWKIGTKPLEAMTADDWVNPATLQFAIISPDGRVGLQAYPAPHLIDMTRSPTQQMGLFPPGSQLGGRTVCPALEPQEFIRQVVIAQQRGLRNVEVIERRPLPALAEFYDKQMGAMNRELGAKLHMVGIEMANRAGLVDVDYEENGVAFRERFVVNVFYLTVGDRVLWEPSFSMSYRAPRQEFEKWQPLVLTSLYSIRFNTYWVAQFMLMRANNGKTVAGIQDACAKIDSDIAAHRAETNMAVNRQMQNVLLPFATFAGPDGQPHMLPNDGSKYQQDDQGNIRSGENLPDDPGWTPLERQ